MNAVNRRARFPLRRVAFAAVAGGAVAATANTVLFRLLDRLGVDFSIQTSATAPAAPIPAPSFAVASFLPALVAGGLLILLDRFTTRRVPRSSSSRVRSRSCHWPDLPPSGEPVRPHAWRSCLCTSWPP